MKKILFLLICTNILFSIKAQQVDENTAEQVAINFFSNFNNSKNVYVKDNIPNYFNNILTFYAVNFEEGGFVVVSPDKKFQPVLCFSEQGSFENKAQLIPSVQYFFNKFNEQIFNGLLNKNIIVNKSEQWDIILCNDFKSNDTIIRPFTTTIWKQSQTNDLIGGGGYCEAFDYYVTETLSDCDDCDHHKCPVGCGATAMAQIFKYYNYAEVNGYNIYDWANMPDSLCLLDECRRLYHKNPFFHKELFAIAHLSRDCGFFSKMDYCTSWGKGAENCESFAWPKDMKKAFKNLGYEDVDLKIRKYNSKKWKQLITTELEAGRPVLYTALSDSVKGLNGGHSFIADGYYYNLDIDEIYFHFNWGHGGNIAQLWMSIDTLILNDINWNNWERAIFNIYPASSTNCSGTIDVGEFYENGGLGDDDFPWNAIPIKSVLLSADKSHNEEYRTIQTGETVNYVAYDQIVLRQGFHVEQGAYFHAYLTECPDAKNTTKNIQHKKTQPTNNQTQQQAQLHLSPNPFKYSVSISYKIPTETNCEISIYNMYGQLQKTIVNKKQTAGTHQIYSNLSNLSVGVYLCVFKSNAGVITQKIIKAD